MINCHALYYWYYKAANIFVPSSALCHVKYQYLKYQHFLSKTYKFEKPINVTGYSLYFNCESYVNCVWTVVK